MVPYGTIDFAVQNCCLLFLDVFGKFDCSYYFYLIGAGPIGILAAQCAAAEGTLISKTESTCCLRLHLKCTFKGKFNIVASLLFHFLSL